jgi:hypothetical protein
MIIRTGKHILLLAVMLSAFLTTACSSATQADNADKPSVEILVPRDDPSATGISGYGFCAVLIDVTDFRLVDKAGDSNVQGEGHIHYYLDVEPPAEPGKPAFTEEGTYADTVETLYYWPEIGKGSHTFWVQLVNNDHTLLDPPVIASASVTAGTWDG